MSKEQQEAINNYKQCLLRKVQAVRKITLIEKRELTEEEQNALQEPIINALKKCIDLGVANEDGIFIVNDNTPVSIPQTIVPPVTDNKTDKIENKENDKLLNVAKDIESSIYKNTTKQINDLKQSNLFRDLSIKEDNLYYNEDLPDYLKIDVENDSNNVIKAKKDAILKWYVQQNANDTVNDILDTSPEYGDLEEEEKQAIRNNTNNYIKQILNISQDSVQDNSFENGEARLDSDGTVIHYNAKNGKWERNHTDEYQEWFDKNIRSEEWKYKQNKDGLWYDVATNEILPNQPNPGPKYAISPPSLPNNEDYDYDDDDEDKDEDENISYSSSVNKDIPFAATSPDVPENIKYHPELWTHINKNRLNTVVSTLTVYVKKDYQDSVSAALQNGKMFDGREINEIITNSINKHIENTISEYTEDEKTYVKYKLEDVRSSLNKAYNDFLNKTNVKKETQPIDNKKATAGNKKGNSLRDYWTKSNVSFSGSDMVVSVDTKTSSGKVISVVVGSAQTISYSIYRKLNPIYCIGNINAKDYVGGPRTIAGSLIFTVFNQHWGTELTNQFFEAEGYAHGRKILMDEIAPINLTITFANEYGICSRLAIYNIRLFSEGQVMSVNDIFTENTYQYVALNIDYLVDLNTNAFKTNDDSNAVDAKSQPSQNTTNNNNNKIKPANTPADLDKKEESNNSNKSDNNNDKDNIPRDMNDNIIDCKNLEEPDAYKKLNESYLKYIEELNLKQIDEETYNIELTKAKEKYNRNLKKIEDYYKSQQPSLFRDLSIKEKNLYYSDDLPDYLKIDIENDTKDTIEAKKKAILQWYIQQNNINNDISETSPEG